MKNAGMKDADILKTLRKAKDFKTFRAFRDEAIAKRMKTEKPLTPESVPEKVTPKTELGKQVKESIIAERKTVTSCQDREVRF